MSPERWLELSCRAFVLGRILDEMPANFPGIRELRIQNVKLQRMLVKPGAKGKASWGQKILGGGSLKKINKQQGRLAAKVGQQARKVQSMAETGFKKWFREDNRLVSNAEFQQWKKRFDAAIDSEAKKIRKQIMANKPLYAPPRTGGIGRLRGR